MDRSRRLDSVRRNLFYAARLFYRLPASTSFIVVLLALGVGATTGVFTLVNAVLLRSLPVVDPQSLYFVDMQGLRAERGGSSFPLFERLKNETSQLSHLAAFQTSELRLTIEDRFEIVSGQYASGNVHDLLGVHAVMGRTLRPEDDAAIGGRAQDGPVAVISAQFWERRFGKRADIVGRAIQVGQTTATIVGVTGAEFFGLQPGRRVDVTLPLGLTNPRILQNKTSSFLQVIGRVRSGGDLDAARNELQSSLTRWANDAGVANEYRRDYLSRVQLTPADKGLDALRRQFSRPLLALTGVAALILLLACSNVAGLLLARVTRRRQELCTRLALGATPSELVGQVAAEVAVLLTAGAVLGGFVAWLTVRVLETLLVPRDLFRLDVPLDLRVGVFALSVFLCTAIVAGIFPAVWTSRFSPAEVLQQQSHRVVGRRSVVGPALLVFQIALAIVLLAAAGLFTKTLQRLTSVDAGFDPTGVLSMRVQANGTALSGDQVRQLWTTLPSALRELPGISDVSLSSLTPLTRNNAGAVIRVPGFDAQSDPDLTVTRNEVTEDYFVVLRIPLLWGRSFEQNDHADAQRVAVINETAARFYFGGVREAVGRTFTFGRGADAAVCEIVGVVKDTTHQSLRQPAPRLFYVPLSQGLEDHVSLTLAARTPGSASGLEAAIRDRVGRISGQVVISDVKPMRAQVDESLRQERTLATLSSLFGGLALLLAVVGLYGVVSQTVTRRTSEIGLRIAMGATPSSIAKLVLGEILTFIAVGVVIGLAGALIEGQLLKSQLFGVQSIDLPTIVTTLTVFAITAAVACAIPLRRATYIEPVIAIRSNDA